MNAKADYFRADSWKSIKHFFFPQKDLGHFIFQFFFKWCIVLLQIRSINVTLYLQKIKQRTIFICQRRLSLKNQPKGQSDFLFHCNNTSPQYYYYYYLHMVPVCSFSPLSFNLFFKTKGFFSLVFFFCFCFFKLAQIIPY